MKPRKKRPPKTVDALDYGTSETRRRLSPDPLSSSTIEPHRLQAALAIRAALEDGLGAPALDIVRIGMGGGASGGDRSYIPTTPVNIENRHHLGRWRLACRTAEIEHHIIELFALGNSFRQIAAQVHLRRTRVAQVVDQGLDLYADLRGLRRHPKQIARIAVWEAPETANSNDPEAPHFPVPVKSRLRNRAIRNDYQTGRIS